MRCVQVSARLLNFPAVCCCCGISEPSTHYCATATRTTGKRVVRTDSRSWNFPLCSHCSEWMRRQHVANANRSLFVALIVLAFLGLVFGIALPPVVLLGIVCGAISPFIFKRWRRNQAAADKIKLQPHCVTEPVVYSGWNGATHTFYFSCSAFTQQFCIANAQKLVGLS